MLRLGGCSKSQNVFGSGLLAFCQMFVLNFQVGTFNLFSVLERMLE